MHEYSEDEEKRLLTEAVKLDATVFGLIFGLVIGLIIFIATNWLILAGGHVGPDGKVVIGPHLQLLGQFFIGYKVTFLGSIIGFLYGFATGSIFGTLISWVYNKIITIRNSKRELL
ncbi:MAG: hypothetical protein GWN11_00770 [Candidatus Dadabacteria bacterium]|nr:hypothetical protein [Candidatus Dadabacteria bacterium]